MLSFLLSSCSAKKKESAQMEESAQVKSLKESYERDRDKFSKRILAGKCRISATVVSIDPQIYSDDPDQPCSKAPCRATIRVDEILGYGAGFNKTLGIGQELAVHFVFSLSPSQEVSRQLQLDLPGLQEGSRFIADLESAPVPGEEEEIFSIYRYELK